MIARAAALLAFLVLAACATAPSAPLPDLSAVPRSFDMNGRIAVRQGDRSDIARLRWSHRPSGDVWVISSPLGNEVARIESGATGAVLRRAGGATEEAESFAVLTERLLGVGLDPDALSTWLHGGQRGELPSDWQVRVEETQRAGTVDLARRISATRGDTVVRLVVDEYRVVQD
jgi:outer membrane biogenesis lipoprotein LolB